MGKSAGKQPTQTTQNVNSSNLPEYARPYFENLMQRSQSLLSQPYTPYGQERIAGFTPEQQQLQQQMLGMQSPTQFGTATNFLNTAGLGTLAASQYNPSQFSAQMVGQPNLQQYQMGLPSMVQGSQFSSPSMSAAQTGFQPNLQQFRMDTPQSFGIEQAQQYMSPYMRSVMDVQKREAVSDARKAQINQDLGAARQGTYGGSRQLLAAMEREKALGQQLGDIEARGLQSAYDNAQQQFERDRAAGMTAGQANLQAALGVQQLGTETGLRAALANLDADSQARVQNLAAQLQTQGLNADQALRAALANQQMQFSTGQQNLDALLQTQQLGTQSGLQALLANQQYGLEAQRLGEMSRQFAAQQALSGFGQMGQFGQTLSNIGSAQQQADLSLFNQQQQTAAQQQALQQQYLDMAYQDFLRQRDYPMEMLQQYSSLLRGVPVQPNSTTTTYQMPPSLASQIMGTGLGALGMYKSLAG